MSSVATTWKRKPYKRFSALKRRMQRWRISKRMRYSCTIPPVREDTFDPKFWDNSEVLSDEETRDVSPINSSLTFLFSQHNFEDRNQAEHPSSSFKPSACISEQKSAHATIKTPLKLEIWVRIALWALKFKIKHNALTNLLKLLKKYVHLSLPPDARKLLGTPKKAPKIKVSGGMYVHFPLEEQIKRIIPNTVENFTEVKLQVNVDGVPLFKSTNAQFHPILCSITSVNEAVSKQVFPAGIWYGLRKPVNTQFLKFFVKDANSLFIKGIILNNTWRPVRVDSFVIDSVEKALIQAIKYPNGRSSCTNCTIVGHWTGSTTLFPVKTCPERTHQGFLDQIDPAHHRGVTVLAKMHGIDFRHSFPLDPMHLLYLGVGKTFLLILLEGPPGEKLKPAEIAMLSRRFVELKEHYPNDFNRKPRDLKYAHKFKATEFYGFLVYSCPIVLQGIVSDGVYSLFMCLHVAIRILAHPVHCYMYNQYADELLRTFVIQFGKIFGEKYWTHNFHNLLHLAANVRKYGPLKNFSAFKFENYLRVLKDDVRKGFDPLGQVFRRCVERNNFLEYETQIQESNLAEGLSQQHSKGPLIGDCTSPQFHVANQGNVVVRCRTPDNCVGIGEHVILVRNIAYSIGQKCMVIVGQQFLEKSDLYTFPCRSSDIGTYKVSKLSELKVWPLTHISVKYALLPIGSGDEFAAMPLLHY